MFIKYMKNDHLIVEVEGKLLFGTAISKNQLLLEKGIEKEATMEQVTFKKKNVKANLGIKPMVGKSVYGINIVPFVRSDVHPNFGQVNIYRELDLKDEERFMKGLDRVWKVLKKNKCIASFPLQAINIHLPKKSVGKFTQKINSKTKEATRSMDFTLEDFSDKDYMNHAMYSLCARAIWINQVPEDIQLKWTKLYHKYLVLKTLNQKQLNAILDSINTYCQDTENASVTSYMKDVCDEEDKIILNHILRHINSIHKIKKVQIDRLIIRDPDFVQSIWPTQVDLSLPKSSVSLAAEKSVEDMFCECMAFHFQGADISKTFAKYVARTLKNMTGKFED